MSGTVWLITHGEYSCYDVDAVCPDEKTANEIVERANRFGGEYEVEEVPLVSEVAFGFTVHKQTFWLADDGVHESTTVNLEPRGYPVKIDFSRSQLWEQRVDRGPEPYITVSVSGDDVERCRKVAGERFAWLQNEALEGRYHNG